MCFRKREFGGRAPFLSVTTSGSGNVTLWHNHGKKHQKSKALQNPEGASLRFQRLVLQVRLNHGVRKLHTAWRPRTFVTKAEHVG